MVRMFQRSDHQYLIRMIPTLKLTFENLNQLSYYDELIDVRSKDDYFLDHLKRPEVSWLWKENHSNKLFLNLDQIFPADSDNKIWRGVY